jgi:hypothetical protein
MLLYIIYDVRKKTSVAVTFHHVVPLHILVPAIHSTQFISNRIFYFFFNFPPTIALQYQSPLSSSAQTQFSTLMNINEMT